MEYDLFISYKSEDAGLVRAVVEELLTAGLRVWFAEYEVLLGNYDRFQSAINQGIDAVRYALLFTNNAWAKSKYCQHEIQRLARRLEPGQILEVCLPREKLPHECNPILRNCPSLAPPIVTADECALPKPAVVRAITEFVYKQMGYHPLAVAPVDDARFHDRTRAELAGGVSLNLGSLRETRMPELAEYQGFGGRSYHFEGPVGGCEVHLLLNINPTQTAITHRRYTTMDLPKGDRAIYGYYRDYAEPQIRAQGADEQGLHLIRWRGNDHFAVTYGPTEFQNGRIGWERTYVLLLRAEDWPNVGEMTLSFFVALPQLGDADPRVAVALDDVNSVRAFLRLSPHFDELVRSIRFDPHGATEPKRPAPPASKTTGAFNAPPRPPQISDTWIVPPPVSWLLSGSRFGPLLGVLFPPRHTPLHERRPMSRLVREWSNSDRAGWFLTLLYANGLTLLALLVFRWAFNPTTRLGESGLVVAYGLGPWIALAVLLGITWGPYITIDHMKRFVMRGRWDDYRAYIGRRLGYDPTRLAGWIALVGIGSCAYLANDLAHIYARFNDAGITISAARGNVRHYGYNEVKSITYSVKSLDTNNQELNLPVCVLEFNDGTRWSNAFQGRTPQAESDLKVMAFVARKSGKSIRKAEGPLPR